VTRKPAFRIIAGVLLVIGLFVSRMAADGELALAGHDRAIPARQPEFTIHWRDDHLELSGHTISSQHEQELLQVIASSYPDAQVDSTFEPLGIVPRYWDRITVQILYLLSDTIAATARLSAQTIDIRGVRSGAPGWQSRLAAVRNALPAGVELSTDALLVDTSVDVAALCQRAFAQYDTGPINFEESTAKFRSSAFPRLQRILALAHACPDAGLAITGHTDASGPESWNQQLSLARATAVGDYLARGGIDAARLHVSGRGSAEPVASNASRYGRSLNRRIEIELRQLRR
tara:strand:- start:20657 stop:21523 length:867 start_codon:yes stop_codon:yes gene_type:complete